MLPASSSSSCHPPVVEGGMVGWNVEVKIVERFVLAAVSSLPPVLASLIASYIPNKPEGVFAENDWNELCGRVAPAPPLPLNIEEIWEGPCPIFPNKKVKDSHVLVYLPLTVDNKPLTLKTLGEIAKQQNIPGSDRGYRYIWDEIVKEMGDQSVGTAGWVLMTKTVINGSRKKSYAIQKTMIKNLAKKVEISYTVPTVLQAVICILTHYMRTRTCLFSDRPRTYTRCQENVCDYQLVVGSFSSTGLGVSGSITSACVGVAALRKFF